MSSSTEEGFGFYLAGFVKLAEHGFALPCFAESFGANTWYIATCSPSGDHNGRVESFSPFEADGLNPLPPTKHRFVRVGDPWTDVFLWRDQVKIGTPTELWNDLQPYRYSILRNAPLSLLDLSSYVEEADNSAIAKRAFSFMERKFGVSKALHWRDNSYLRGRLISNLRQALGSEALLSSNRVLLQQISVVSLEDNRLLINVPKPLLRGGDSENGAALQDITDIARAFKLKIRVRVSTSKNGEISPQDADKIISIAQSLDAASVSHLPPTFQGSASGSSFYAAMRILPREQREAMFQIYSFCRQVDDIADSDGPREQRLAALQEWRNDIDLLYQGNPPERLRDYVASVNRFSLKREDFLAIVDGMEMDVPADIRAPDLATLDLYCDRVASAVGRLSVRVFGLNEEDGIELAHHLGRALQLTNILRDIDEDAFIGRLYLPREALLHAGITSTDPLKIISNPRLPKVCAPLAERARQHFVKADEVMDRNRRRVVRAPRIMSKYYRAILDLLVARGFAPPRAPVRLNKAARLAILLRYAII